MQGGVPVIRDQDALATHHIVGREAGPQLGIGDLPVQVLKRDFLTQGHVLGVDHRAKGLHFVQPVNAPALEPHHPRQVAVKRFLQGAERAVLARYDPRRGALEHTEPLDARRNLRHELDGAGSAADHRHALALQGIVVVPARRVEGASRKGVQPRQAGYHRLAQTAGTQDQEAAA
ncbi:hypothetical protein D9M71_500470 [compost metagenome]